jgi:anaerobic magnesium-protoporphyrin IX monomethyl ester cyclase
MSGVKMTLAKFQEIPEYSKQKKYTIKTLLINPPYTGEVYSGFKPAVQVQIPLGLGYIASVFREADMPVQLIDANAEGLDINKTIDRIIDSDADIVGITSTTLLLHIVTAIVKGVKHRSKKKVILGGPHVTFFPRETLEACPEIDIIVIGEGEAVIKELLENNFQNLSNIQGIAYKSGKKIIINQKRDRIKNLDELSFPSRDLFNQNLYRPGALWNIGFSGKKSMTIITSRGCPSRCRYCSSLHFWGPLVRLRSVNNIISEIEFLKKTYEVQQIAILDDTFLANQKRTEQFCDEIIKRKIKISWWCYARLDKIYSDSLFRKMRKAGCYGLNFGVESGNQDILDGIGKNIKIDVVKKVIANAKKHGFLVMSSFMIGLPGDTRKTVIETINFAIELNPHVAQFCITTPFPGTDLYNEAISKGWMENVSGWEDVGLHQKTKFHNADLTSEEIYEFYQLSHKKFYFRIRYFLLIFFHLIKNPRQIHGFVLSGIYMITEIFHR